jgi:hypothetical protein
MTFSESFEQVLSAFNESGVNYMLVGGFAVNFHGYNRSTSDLNIWVKRDSENKQKIYYALTALGFTAQNLEQFSQLSFDQAFVFSIGLGPVDVEIFNAISGVEYEDAEPHKIQFTADNNLPVYFISLKDLIVNKMLAGRPQDAADVSELQRIQNLKKPDFPVRL